MVWGGIMTAGPNTGKDVIAPGRQDIKKQSCFQERLHHCSISHPSTLS